MILACMIGLDEDALICDLAETYHIYKFDDFDAGYIATLAAGLRDDARIVKKITGCDLSMAELLAAVTADNLTVLNHGLAGEKKRPHLFTEKLNLGKEAEKQGFASGAEFDVWRRSILKGR